jgi:hypothetical protein
MPGRVPDVLEVVVLAARAHAALRRRGAFVRTLVEPGEHVLELDHPRIDEKERRVVGGHERARRHVRMAVGDEILDEPAADVGDLHVCFRARFGRNMAENQKLAL